MIDQMDVKTADGVRLVKEGNALNAHEASMGLRIEDDSRIDLSLADGDAKKRYGWIDPNQDLFLNEFDGKIGEHELSTDTNIGHIEWHIKAARANER